jgi:hypothetical protein
MALFPSASHNHLIAFLRSLHLSVSFVQHLMLLLSLSPPAPHSLSPLAPPPNSFLQPHEVELRYILGKDSLQRVSRFMTPQMKRMAADAARDVMKGFSQKPVDTRL